jgi:hypothetical protein
MPFVATSNSQTADRNRLSGPRQRMRSWRALLDFVTGSLIQDTSCTFHPSHYDDRPTRRSRRRTFCRRRICSGQAATPNPESFPTPFTQTARLRSRSRRLVCSPHAPRPTDPFRNRIETVNTLEPPSSAEESQITAAVFPKTQSETGTERPKSGSYSCRY